MFQRRQVQSEPAMRYVMKIPRDNIFRLPAGCLASRYRGNRHRIPCRNLTVDQTFMVDEVGVYWVGHHRQEQTLGGDHHIVPLEQCDGDNIVWVQFLEAVRRTRVHEEMVKLQRNDLRCALWLSRQERNGQYRFLQYCQNHPELTTELLPHPDEGERWRSEEFRKAWKLVARNAGPRRIARWTTLGPRYAKAPKLRSSDVVSGVRARDLLTREHHDIFRAWDAIAHPRLQAILWREPNVIVEVVSPVMCHFKGRTSQWMPASLILSCMLNSGLDAVARASAVTPHPLDGLCDAAEDLFNRIFVPQLLSDDRVENAEVVAARLVKLWLRLRHGTPAERNEMAKRFPGAAREAERYGSVRLRWKDLVRWNSLYHQPDRLARALSVVTGGEWPEVYGGRLATPLIMDAGGRPGAGVRRIESVSELRTLAWEEEHCIALYELALRRGEFHCFVIEDEFGRSTMLARERVRWRWREGKSVMVLDRHDPYRFSQCRMRRNAPSPPAHLRCAREMIDEWCRLAASMRSIHAGPREMRIRSTSIRITPTITPERMEQYWREISKDCVPEWALDFDPAKGLMRRLFSEYCHVGMGFEEDDCGRPLSAG